MLTIAYKKGASQKVLKSNKVSKLAAALRAKWEAKDRREAGITKEKTWFYQTRS